jgi:hypothetical protein
VREICLLFLSNKMRVVRHVCRLCWVLITENDEMQDFDSDIQNLIRYLKFAVIL